MQACLSRFEDTEGKIQFSLISEECSRLVLEESVVRINRTTILRYCQDCCLQLVYCLSREAIQKCQDEVNQFHGKRWCWHFSLI